MLLLIVVASLTRPPAASGGQNLYIEAVRTYQAGRFEEALEQLHAIPYDRLVTETMGFLINATPPMLRAAFALRAESQLSRAWSTCTWSIRDSGGRELQDEYDKRLVSLPGGLALIRAKALLFISYNQGHNAIREAADCYDGARSDIRDHPEALLALCAIHETGWRMQHEDDQPVPGFEATLRRAESACRAATTAAPDLEEAWLRLAHAMSLQDRQREALEILRAGHTRDRGFTYLAMLFEGRMLQQLGQPDEAAKRFASARAMFPDAESARVAEAALAFSQGRRSEAARKVQEFTSETPDNDTADPWLWYTKGTAWRAGDYLAELRRLATAPNK